jgi:Tol biopolymer transport system component
MSFPSVLPTSALSAAILVWLAMACLAVGSPAPASGAGPGTIAFTRDAVVDGKSGESVWLVSGDGTEVRPLRPRRAGVPTWVADGRRLALLGRSIVAVPRGGRDVRRFAISLPVNRDNRINSVDWAPDGEFLAFDYYARRADTTRIVVQAPSPAPSRELPLGETEVLAGPAWSPRGRTIAAVGALPELIVHPGPRYETVPPIVGVWLLNPAGGDPRRLATWPQTENRTLGQPAWSPDGADIVVPYSVDAGGPTPEGLYADRDDHAQLLLIDAGNGRVRELLRDPEPGTRYSLPAWSPNGRLVAYARRGDIWVVDVRTGKAKNLTRARRGVIPEFAWSPDSRRIALACNRFSCGRPKGIWTVTLSRKWKRLTRGFDFSPAWGAR